MPGSEGDLKILMADFLFPNLWDRAHNIWDTIIVMEDTLGKLLKKDEILK